MTTDGHAPAEETWTEFDRSGRYRTGVAKRLERVLLATEHGSPEAPRNAADLAETVHAARDAGVVFDEDLTRRAWSALASLYSAHGVGSVETGAYDDVESRAGMHLGEVRVLLEELAEELGDSARNSVKARIMSAQIYAREDGGADRRGAELEKAFDLCRTNHERVDVAIVKAQYHVDICGYREATRLLEDSTRLVRSDDSCADLLPELTACHGGLLFAQGRLRSARRRFRDTLAAMDRLSRNHRERPAIKAHHYLAKIHALYGRYELAVRYLVDAEELVHDEERSARGMANDPRQSGHNHNRLADVLEQAGSPDAQWHKSKAQDLFIAAGEESSGRGQHYGVAAAPGESIIERIKRHQRMLSHSQRNRHGRGVVIASLKLALLHRKHGELRSAVRYARSTLVAGMPLVRESGIFAATAGVVELATAHALRKMRTKLTTLLGSPPLRCPCRHCSPPQRV
jgi:hypothetical protein